jgi:hypothetical protein
MKRTTTLFAAAIVSMVAGLGIATSSFALSRTTQSGNTHITTPTYDAGARARAFDIQNGTMWNRDLGWWTYRPQTGTYFNPRTGVTCTAAAAACF